MIKEIPPILKVYRAAVPPAVDKIISLTTDLKVSQKAYKQKTAIVDEMTAMLKQIKPQMS